MVELERDGQDPISCVLLSTQPTHARSDVGLVGRRHELLTPFRRLGDQSECAEYEANHQPTIPVFRLLP